MQVFVNGRCLCLAPRDIMGKGREADIYAVGPSLLVPTDDGIVRLDAEHDQIVRAKSFADTEPYVDAASRLLAGPNGVYVVREQTIHLLSINEDGEGKHDRHAKDATGVRYG